MAAAKSPSKRWGPRFAAWRLSVQAAQSSASRWQQSYRCVTKSLKIAGNCGNQTPCSCSLKLEPWFETADNPDLVKKGRRGRGMLNRSIVKNSGAFGAAALDFGAFAAMCPSVTTRVASDSPRNPRVALLTEAERECLRLVYQHMTSKDIARQLGVSPHTVDMRLRQAIRKLEVTNRVEASRVLLIEELTQGMTAEDAATAQEAARSAYQPLIYQAPEIVDAAGSATVGAPASPTSGAVSDRSSDPKMMEPGSLARALHQAPDRLVAGPSGGSLAQPDAPSGNVAPATLATDWPGISAPDPGIGARPFLATRPWGSRNTLGIGQRLGWIMAIAMASALSFGGILAALAALKTLI